MAIAFLNRNSVPKYVSASYKDLELNAEGEYEIYDVWSHKKLKQSKGELAVTLEPHECQVFVLSSPCK